MKTTNMTITEFEGLAKETRITKRPKLTLTELANLYDLNMRGNIYACIKLYEDYNYLRGMDNYPSLLMLNSGFNFIEAIYYIELNNSVKEKEVQPAAQNFEVLRKTLKKLDCPTELLSNLGDLDQYEIDTSRSYYKWDHSLFQKEILDGLVDGQKIFINFPLIGHDKYFSVTPKMVADHFMDYMFQVIVAREAVNTSDGTDLRYSQTLYASELEGMPEQIHTSIIVTGESIGHDISAIENYLERNFVVYKRRVKQGTTYFDMIDKVGKVTAGDRYEILFRTKQGKSFFCNNAEATMGGYCKQQCDACKNMEASRTTPTEKPSTLSIAEFSNKYVGITGKVIMITEDTDLGELLIDITHDADSGKSVWYKLPDQDKMFRLVNPRQIDWDDLGNAEKIVVIPANDITKKEESPLTPTGRYAKDLYSMQLHEEICVNMTSLDEHTGGYRYDVIRVPGGWLYVTAEKTATFVPFHNEYQEELPFK